MSQGAIPRNLPCTYCRSYVSEIDAMWENGLPYHESCFSKTLARQIANYEKKMRIGTLTLADAKEMADMKDLYMKLRQQLESRSLHKHFYPDVARFNGNTPLGLYSATKPKPKPQLKGSASSAGFLGGDDKK